MNIDYYGKVLWNYHNLNQKIKTEVNFNSVNEQNNNSENKPRNKKLTIVLIFGKIMYQN